MAKKVARGPAKKTAKKKSKTRKDTARRRRSVRSRNVTGIRTIRITARTNPDKLAAELLAAIDDGFHFSGPRDSDGGGGAHIGTFG